MSSHHQVSKETHQGLDRAPIDTYMTFENHEQERGPDFPTQADKVRDNEIVATDESHGPNKLHRLSKRLQVKLQSKGKGDSDMHGDATTLAPTLAPEPLLTTQNERFSGEMPKKPSAPPLKEFVTKPVGTIKSLVHSKGGNEFAENVANTEVSHGANVNFVLAHEKIAASMNDRARLIAVQDFEDLKKVRQDSLVRWTMDRHVRKVRAVQAQKSPRLGRKDFVRNDGGREKTYWLDYGHHVRRGFLCSRPSYWFDYTSQGVISHEKHVGTAYIRVATRLLCARICWALHRGIVRTSRTNRKRSYLQL